MARRRRRAEASRRGGRRPDAGRRDARWWQNYVLTGLLCGLLAAGAFGLGYYLFGEAAAKYAGFAALLLCIIVLRGKPLDLIPPRGRSQG
jgi:hypothetical protein